MLHSLLAAMYICIYKSVTDGIINFELDDYFLHRQCSAWRYFKVIRSPVTPEIEIRPKLCRLCGSKSPIALSVMHHPVFGIIFQPHSVNLARSSTVTTITLSITSSLFHFRLKTHLFHKSFPPISYPPDCPLDFNRTAFTDFVPLCVMF